jgi:hypothetical protein
MRRSDLFFATCSRHAPRVYWVHCFADDGLLYTEINEKGSLHHVSARPLQCKERARVRRHPSSHPYTHMSRPSMPPDYRTSTTHIEVLCAALSDCGRGLPCPIEFWGHWTYFAPLVHASEHAVVQHYVHHVDQVRAAAVGWIAAPRPVQELARLWGSTCTCSVDMRSGAVHQEGWRALSVADRARPIPMILVALLRVVERALAQSPAVALHRISTRKMWPTQLDHILPYGAEGTIRGLLRWLEIQPKALLSVALLQAATGILEHTTPLTLPYFITSTNLMRCGVFPVLAEVRALSMDYHDSVTVLCHCANVMFSILDPCDTVQRAEMLANEDKIRLVVTFDQAIETLSKEVRKRGLRGRFDVETAFKRFTNIVCILTIDRLPRLKRLSLFVFPKNGIPLPEWSIWMPLVNVLRLEERCNAPDCKLVLAGEKTPCQYCGGCRRVMYCSRRCQKAAWAHPHVPHRNVCAAIRQTCSLYPLVKRGSLTGMPMSAPEPFDEALAESIVEFFTAQRRYQIKYSRKLLLSRTPVHHILNYPISFVQTAVRMGG